MCVAKSGGDEVFLNFFSSLCDALGVALVLVGTPNSTGVLSETFTATRRLTSGGDIHRDRFKKEDPNWREINYKATSLVLNKQDEYQLDLIPKIWKKS